ncbi:MAG: helix-turn-helix domain-containing protein, partial [Defluviitaleaceae bacterium]|nr:helix-turn-helix domain-containing protein [Defluviitaleaceae bacterium]
MEVGARIKEARIHANLTQKQLGEKLGVAAITIRQYENDKRGVSLKLLEKIAGVLDTSVTFLIDGCAEFSEKEGKSPFWSADLEDKLKQVGYSTGFDEDNATVWINYPDGTLEVTDDELKELHTSSNEYMRFKLEELKKKRAQDFRPRRGAST